MGRVSHREKPDMNAGLPDTRHDPCLCRQGDTRSPALAGVRVMTSTESDSKDFDWTEIERAVENELLNRAKRVAQRITERVKRATEGSGPDRKLGPNDPTDVCPVM